MDMTNDSRMGDKTGLEDGPTGRRTHEICLLCQRLGAVVLDMVSRVVLRTD